MYGQTTASDGAMVLRGLTLPRGGVWLANNAGGGHFWVPDGVLGFCRVDPSPGANPPFTTSNCGTAAKTASQAVVATPAPGFAGLPAGAKFVFVADASSKSNAVVRYVFNPATETLSGALTIQVPNVTNVGGGSAGGRAQAVAMAANGTDLYVGYKASGDIMKVANATSTTSGSPGASKVGSSSDGRGVWSLLLFKNDLYLGENGGQGLSKIASPGGATGQAACTGSCTAVNIGISAFPGGLAADSTYIYIGDAPRIGTNQILRWNPATGTVDQYSLNVTTYTATADGVSQSQFSTYAGPLGVALAPNGDLYVGDDPSFSFVAPAANPNAAAPTTQGHLWKITPGVNNTPPPPSVTVTAIAPTNGSNAGGTAVTITGTGFSTNPGGTFVNFGSIQNAANTVTCASATSCTATSPAGSGTVDVRVTVNGVQSPALGRSVHLRGTCASCQWTEHHICLTQRWLKRWRNQCHNHRRELHRRFGDHFRPSARSQLHVCK